MATATFGKATATFGKEVTRTTPEGDVIRMKRGEDGETIITAEFSEVHMTLTSRWVSYYDRLTKQEEPCLLLTFSWKQMTPIEFPEYERELVYLPSKKAYCFSWETDFSAEHDALQTWDSYPWEPLEAISDEFPRYVRWVIHISVSYLCRKAQ